MTEDSSHLIGHQANLQSHSEQPAGFLFLVLLLHQKIMSMLVQKRFDNRYVRQCSLTNFNVIFKKSTFKDACGEV